MMTAFVLVSLASVKLRICKSVSVCSVKLKPSKLQDHFDNRHGGATVIGYDENSLRAKRIRFDSRATLPKLRFGSIDEPLLMASCQVAFKAGL